MLPALWDNRNRPPRSRSLYDRRQQPDSDHCLRTKASEVEVANSEKPMTENSETRACSIQECTGTYEVRRVIHTARYRGAIIVVENVPAEVCSVCSDVLFTPETVEHLQRIVRERSKPAARHAPVYQYA